MTESDRTMVVLGLRSSLRVSGTSSCTVGTTIERLLPLMCFLRLDGPLRSVGRMVFVLVQG